MNLPTRKEIEALWEEYRVPPLVRRHSEQVAKVALFLAKKLKEKGMHVDAGVAEAAGLLHDLVRTANFYRFDDHNAPDEDVEFWKKLKKKHGNIHHADIAAGILKERYPEVAEAIRAHSIEGVTSDSILSSPWEAKVLVYADHRVLHDKIVSSRERNEDGKARHGSFYERLKKETGKDYRKMTIDNVEKIERQIFSRLDIKPEDINDKSVGV